MATKTKTHAALEEQGLDRECAMGLHSWIHKQGRLPANERCTRCGERYGNPK